MSTMINEEFSKLENDKIEKRIYFPELDGLRFLAFLLVFIHHSWLLHLHPYFSFMQTNGWIGVDLFFVLSAFLFTKLLIAEYNKTETINFKKFYIRRIFRIWPIYFLFVGFSILIFNHNLFSNEIWNRLIGLLTFSDNIVTAFKGANPIPYTSHLWTIAYEEQFYIFIPLVILFLVRATNKTKLISATIVFFLFNFIRILFIKNQIPHPAIWVLPITHFESIFIGIIIGFNGLDFLVKKINPLIFGILGILFFIFICISPSLIINSYWLIISYTLVGLSTSFVLLAVLNSTLLKKIFSNKVLVFLGKRSYGLYVYHLFGNAFAEYLISHFYKLPSSKLAAFLYSLFFTIILSIISYQIIEKPFLKLKKKFEVVSSRPI